MERADTVKKRGSKFVVFSMAGKELGEFDTETEANERLRQIEAAKAAKSDSAVRRVDHLGTIHFDRERMDGALATFTEEGFLRVDARLTRTGVFTYGDGEGNTWGELRTPEEVFHEDALRSFEMVVLTDDHPAEFVNAANVRDVQVGHVGTDVRRDGDFVVASIVVTDEKTIRSITDGKVELSCGYTAQVIKEDGQTQAGESFAARQTAIRGNHVALVDRGRAGPRCRLKLQHGDAAQHLMETPMDKPETPELRTVTIDGVEHSVPVAVADALTTLRETPEETETTTMTNDNEEATRLRARVDALEAELSTARESETARIDARVNLVTTARDILGPDHRTDGVGDLALMRDVVLHVNPKLKDRLDANADDAGYLRASFEAAVDLHRDRATVADEIPTTLFDAMGGGEDRLDLDAEHRAYVNRMTGRGAPTEA